jgi:hypothetical protein
MIRVLLGNDSPLMQVQMDDKQVSRAAEHLPHGSTTVVKMREGFDDEEFVTHVLSTDNDRMLTLISRAMPTDGLKYSVGTYEIEHVISRHSGSNRPTWVWSDDEVFAKVLSDYYGVPVSAMPQALLTNVGRDDIHLQHLDVGAQPAAYGFGGLSANNGSGFAVTDTTLAGEITTAGGGLLRKAMTFAHTTGTNTSTLTATWACNSSDVLPVTLDSLGIFNAVTAGHLGWEDPMSTSATLAQSGDSLTDTFTLTAG